MSVCNVPDGSGQPLTRARTRTTPPGVWVDATITLTMIDHGGTPIYAYPHEDLWLENNPPVPPSSFGDPPGLVACPNGAIADAPTDVDGRTTFTGPFFAGGHVTYSADGDADNDDMTYVVVSGFTVPRPQRLLFNSPDINGDGVWVAAVDVILFSAARNTQCP